jgi:hypothetical protein
MALEMQESLIRSLNPTEAGSSLTSVNDTLTNFGLPPVRTMTVIRKCRGYIAGSSVLAGRPNLPAERQFPPGDLDVYIPLKYSEVFKSFLLESGDRHMCRELDLQASDQKPRYACSCFLIKICAETNSAPGRRKPSSIAKIWYFRDENGKMINVIVSSTRYVCL